MGRSSEDKLPAFVEDLKAHGVKTLTAAYGLSEAAATAAMLRIAEDVCAQYARTHIYVPIYDAPALLRRDSEIEEAVGQNGPRGARRHTPSRVREVAVHWRLTECQVYNILRAQRRRRAAAAAAAAEQATPRTHAEKG